MSSKGCWDEMRDITLSDIIDKTGVFVDGDWIETKDQDPEGDVRLIQLADVGDGEFLDKSNRFMKKAKALQLKCTFLKKGDVLIARMPDPLGRACIFPGSERECVTVVDVCIVRPNATNVSNQYLKYLINNANFRASINVYTTGTTRKRISRNNLDKIHFNIPVYNDQIRIATILTRAERLIAKRKDSIRALDELLKSTFLEMFGDPVRNEKGWDKKNIKRFGEIITGNTPPRNNPDNYSSNYIEWIKSDNIVLDRTYLTVATEYLSEIGVRKARIATAGALLVACIAGSIESIGRAAIANRQVAFNQQINAIQPNDETNSLFLYWLFKISKLYIQSYATKGMKKILTKGDFEKIAMISPPYLLQTQFAAIAEKIESIKAKYTQSLEELENLYGSLSQRAFKGELDLSKVPLEREQHMIEVGDEGIAEEILTAEVPASKKYSEAELISIIRKMKGGKFTFSSLMDAIIKADFDEMPEYEKIKTAIFRMLDGETPMLSQVFDEKDKQIVLRVNP